MSKKGFTFIELLAVIVILAIISIIAIPLVLNVINSVRKNSTETSMRSIDRIASLYYQNNRKEGNIIFECSNNKCKFNEEELKIKGKIPESGKILIDKSGNITYEDIVLNGFNCYKEHDKFVCDSKKTRKVYKESEIVLNSDKEYDLFDYNIYGNSIQNEETLQYESVGDKSENLWEFDLKEINTSSKGKIYTFNNPITKPCTFFYENNNYNSTGNVWFIGFKYKSGTYTYVYPNHIKGNNIIKINATEDNPLLYVEFRNGGTNYISEGSIDSFMLVEGTYDTNTMPEYEPYNKYKIPVKVNGKNLVNIKAVLDGKTKVNGMDLTYNDDGSFNLIGTAKQSYEFYFNDKNKVLISSGEIVTGITTYDCDVSTPQIGLSIRNGNTQKAIFSGRLGVSEKMIITGAVDNVALRLTNFDVGTYYEIRNIRLQLEVGEIATEYEPGYNRTTNIYLDEPLRKLEDKADYIDFKNGKVVRYIEEDNEGNLTVLSVPKEEKIELPEILLHKGTNNIEIGTSIKPSKIELEFYK